MHCNNDNKLLLTVLIPKPVSSNKSTGLSNN